MAVPRVVAAADFRPAGPIGFTLLRGQPAFGPRYSSRLARSVFRAEPGGAFAMFQPDGYPTLVGTWSEQGAVATVQASSAVGRTTVEMNGTITTVGAQRTLQMSYVSSTSMAANVNNTPFGYNSAAAYQAVVALVA